MAAVIRRLLLIMCGDFQRESFFGHCPGTSVCRDLVYDLVAISSVLSASTGDNLVDIAATRVIVDDYGRSQTDEFCAVS